MRRVSGIDHASKNRLRLWLRGERAFGLSAVPSPPLAEFAETPPQTAAPAGATRTGQEFGVANRSSQNSSGARGGSPARVLSSEKTFAAKLPMPQESAPVFIPLPSAPGFTAPLLERGEKIVRLQMMDDDEVKGCTRCGLHETRTRTVFGEGDPDAKIFFVGEGPGENEDLTGRPFVGRAGQLLDKMIAGMGLSRQQVYIGNIVKCRPPNNRVPGAGEVATCTPYLERQLEIIRPRVIVTLGRPATTYMLNSKASMGSLRGRWQSWRGIKLMPTFHPSYVLRSYTEEVRAAVWSDLKQVLVELGMPVPKKSSG
jgi:uracil-DNA glycosylase family 4